MTACPTCGATVTLEPAPEQAVTAGALTLRVTGLRAAVCPQGHRHVVPVDAAARSADHVGAMLLSARTTGVLRRRTRCGECDAELVLPPRRTDTPVPADLDGHVVTVVVDAPMARCPACGLEQLVPGVQASVGPALDEAVRGVEAG